MKPTWLKTKLLRTGLIISALAASACLPTALAQGTVVFNTRVPGIVDARVFCGDSITPAHGSLVSAQLWGGPSPDSLQPLDPVTTFRTGAFAGYVAPPAEPVVVPGVPEGGMAWIQLRVWDNFEGNLTWETARGRGESNLIVVGPLGGEMLPPAYLEGLHSFQPGLACIPEPRSVFLLVVGIGCAMFLGSGRSRLR